MVSKKKKTIDGYYYDGKTAWILYKDENGKITQRRMHGSRKI